MQTERGGGGKRQRRNALLNPKQDDAGDSKAELIQNPDKKQRLDSISKRGSQESLPETYLVRKSTSQLKWIGQNMFPKFQQSRILLQKI